MVPPRPRELVLRERLVVLRERDAVLRGDFAFAVDFFAAGFRAVDAALERDADGFARDDVDLPAAALEGERDAEDFRAVDFRAVDLRAVDLRAVDFRAVDLRVPLLLVVLEPSSAFHLPDITRCAASATASAINEPSLAALDATLLAACCAVSAASRPASRIARRALGLALIAAAAAARPAASISLLIAAFAILSMVSEPDDREDVVLEVPDLEELEREEPEEPFRADLAIAYLPPSRRKDTLAL